MAQPQLQELLEQLWGDYVRVNPQARAIWNLLESKGEQVMNDHIAFRTYDDSRIGINAVAATFIQLGYEPKDTYAFEQKKLSARHFEHPDQRMPKVFISELQTAEFSDELRDAVQGLVDQIKDEQIRRWDFPVLGRPWQVSHATYERMRQESEYAAWLAAWGFRANHFTILVNAFKSIDSLEQLNELLQDNGFALNRSGGDIKGSPEVFLEQSSTLASEVPVQFSDGTFTIPGCYYEFARRHTMPDGKLFQGFVARSADRIFESTDKRDRTQEK